MLNFRLLANYNKITNDLMNKIIKNITEEEWNKKFGGYFRSIHELNSHIYICDFNWLKRFKNLREFNVHKNKIFEKEYKFTEVIFENIMEYISMRAELDEIIIKYINELKEEDLEKYIKFTNSKGVEMERKMETLITHVFNHETHHRGMISIYLEMLGKENSYSDSMYNTEM
jgi:uncharacterized damage-inducible protein DinB